jgi:hypothetical protein
VKAFCSLSDYLGGVSFAALNQKNSTSLMLGTQTAFDFHPPSADLTHRFSRRLFPKILECRSQKPFTPFASYFLQFFIDHNIGLLPAISNGNPDYFLRLKL